MWQFSQHCNYFNCAIAITSVIPLFLHHLSLVHVWIISSDNWYQFAVHVIKRSRIKDWLKKKICSFRKLHNETTNEIKKNRHGARWKAWWPRFRRLLENLKPYWWLFSVFLSFQVDQSRKGSVTRARAAISPS